MNDKLTETIIGAAFKVHNQLGFGFLESIYEKALSIELTKLGIAHKLQSRIQVYYDEHLVGEFAADVLVEQEKLILELKSVANFSTTHEVQLVNYLAATRIEMGLLINFGPTKVEVRRKFRTYKKPA